MKREYLALQDLGERLITLTPAELNTIGLEERLLDAVIAAKSMRAHGALRRQKQLIGRLMRGVDAAPIRSAIDALGQNDRQEKAIFSQAEKWRDRIATGEKDELAAFFDHLGYRNETLADEVAALLSARHERGRREAKRRIFREIHGDLSRRMQS